MGLRQWFSRLWANRDVPHPHTNTRTRTAYPKVVCPDCGKLSAQSARGVWPHKCQGQSVTPSEEA